MNMKEWTKDLIGAKPKKALPVLSFPCVSLLGITVNDLIASEDAQAEGMAAVAARTPSLASVSMMDLSVEAEAFGATARFSDREVPTVTGILLENEEAAKALAIPKVGAGRTGRYINAVKKAKERITDRPVFAGVIGPFSLAGRLMGVSEAMYNCYEEPEFVHTVLEKTTAFLTEYISAYRAAGVDGVVMAEPLTGLLSPKLAGEFSCGYVKKIIDATRTDAFGIIYHNCGNNVILQIEDILSIGADAYHFGNSIDMREMLPKVPADTVVMGNIDPAGLFLRGTPEAIYNETLSLMNALCGEYPNFVISSGCDIPPMAPWENINAFYAAVADYNKQ